MKDHHSQIYLLALIPTKMANLIRMSLLHTSRGWDKMSFLLNCGSVKMLIRMDLLVGVSSVDLREMTLTEWEMNSKNRIQDTFIVSLNQQTRLYNILKEADDTTWFNGRILPISEEELGSSSRR